MCYQLRHVWRLSFTFAVVFTVSANFFNVIGFVSPDWIVAKEGVNSGFQSLGLWSACFNNFIFAEDYISKAYDGCWYIYRQEFKYIRFWLNPYWFLVVQILSIVNIICSLGAIILIFQNAMGVETAFCKMSNRPTIFLQCIVVACLTVITIYVGIMSKDRQWIPFSDRNTVSWGLAFAATAGILTCLSIICLAVDQLAHYSEILYQRLLEEQGLLSPDHFQTAKFGHGSGFEVNKRGEGGESKAGVPSLFMTGSIPSVSGHGRLSSILGKAKSGNMPKSGLLSRLEETVRIPGTSLNHPSANVEAISAAVASAKLREELQESQKRPVSRNVVGDPRWGSIHSLQRQQAAPSLIEQESIVHVYQAPMSTQQKRAHMSMDSAV